MAASKYNKNSAKFYKPGHFKFSDIDPIEIAQQMTLIEFGSHLCLRLKCC